ncbi:MAG: Asp-tRNA(Asn)/Glu-tRNA(Gln) amidotransferase subunit GatA [Patescibacteria group bacterium]|nr:Asp-tRNA(Asn)/Glu-tRNA(Gln) amidotransferase subunit GatA [Patescibacteria group bacterium]
MNLHDLTITEAKNSLRKREISSAELTKLYLDQIKKVNPILNAYLTVTEEKAMKDAAHADKLFVENQDAPLLGIPFSIKDNFLTEGIRTTASSKVLDSFIPPFNATVVERLKQAGIVCLGKTNMDAWAHGSSTETSDYGVTKNPWDTNRLPGGSSGGGAAAMASDLCLAAIGSETAGSIRLPAAWCGVVGLKPTYGRVSRYGVVAMASSTDSPGPLTKTVEDAAIILQVLAGKDAFDGTTSDNKPEDYLAAMKTPRKMTIGISEDYFIGVNGEIVKAVQDAITLLEKKGHKVKKIKLFDPKYAIDVYTILQRSEVSSNLARFDGIRYGNDRSFFGEEARRRIMLGTYALSSGYYDAYYKKAQKVRTIIIEDFNKAFAGVDVIVSPTTPVTALPLGATKDSPMFGELMDVLVEPSSIAGICGINMPVGFSKEGLPIGMQIMAKQFAESTILNLAYQYEQETKWREEKPKI